MNEIKASQTTHWLNRFRMALAVLLPLSALLTPKDPSVYLSKWGVAAVTLYTLGCLSIFWLIYLIASVEELIIAATMKERFDPFRKSVFCKSQR